MASKPNIPTEEEFDRASKNARARSEGLDDISADAMNRLGALYDLEKISILPQRDVDFRVYVFFRTDVGLSTAPKLGIDQIFPTTSATQSENLPDFAMWM